MPALLLSRPGVAAAACSTTAAPTTPAVHKPLAGEPAGVQQAQACCRLRMRGCPARQGWAAHRAQSGRDAKQVVRDMHLWATQQSEVRHGTWATTAVHHTQHAIHVCRSSCPASHVCMLQPAQLHAPGRVASGIWAQCKTL
ncbi:hypothetical protein COO60DRAFT_1545464, partial [Scenedesmus sp. NREL 46B-D3]